MSWNLQTFFDAEFDGNEYSEYKTAKYGWSEEKYAARLDRLVSVIKELDADIVVMEELEKEAQLQDIANRLSGTFYLSKTYRYASFTKENGSSIGCAVLSRIPIESVTVHSIDIRTSQTQPALRPITSVLLTKDGTPLVLLINHWKSKSGDAERSEIWRQWQELVLTRLMKKAKGKNQERIFQYKDKPLKYENVKYIWDKINEATNINKKLHNWRHTWASNMLKRGWPIAEVSRILGHSDPSITMRIYTHSIPNSNQRLINEYRSSIKRKK